MTPTIPVIAIDGPGGAGKGTLARELADRLGWHLLDSGALYRLVALSAMRDGVGFENEQALVAEASALNVEFRSGGEVLLSGEDVTECLGMEETGARASLVAAIPEVRDALLQRQRDLAVAPGLVADGRDMGTVVFPEAPLKVFLDASPEKRAKRRQKQLQNQGIDVTFDRILADIVARDARDSGRSVAPLKAASDAVAIDSSYMSASDVYSEVMKLVRSRGLQRS